LLESLDPEVVLRALAEARDRLPADGSAFAHPEIRGALLALLDAGRRPAFLRRIADTPLAQRWLDEVLASIDRADVGLGDLFALRASQGPDRTCLMFPASGNVREVRRGELWKRVQDVAAGLLDLLPGESGRVAVALLAPNRLETMLVDLACLTHGIVDTPIPGDSTPEQIRIILEQIRPSVLVVADAARLQNLLSGGSVPSVRTIILMDPPEDGVLEPGTLLLSKVEETGRKCGAARPIPRAARDVATIMFTSGTTGRPKGIRFSQRAIVFKRFCRAVALPRIGEDDVFLCYLPLFHTFGRWLEMTGTLFWGAVYAFQENPSGEATLAGMRATRPSVFISIPKRWIQIKDLVVRRADPNAEDPHTIDPSRLQRALHDVTGGRLAWGLSAAGYLDPDIFQFFQRNGVELMSGFGMTEATGGITMTPPGRYRRGTVGVALPGAEVRRAEDGELLVRSPYMMLGYDDVEEPRPDYERDWFPTGDLVESDPDGYVTIVDRKKDIYKNVKGQTVAPQKVENLFDEFEEIKRTFLVGDGREYNTLLVYPDVEASGGKLARMRREELREYLSSYVVSVNRFLAPFERVVDFEVLPRYFQEDRGELTPKGTFVRKVVERNFMDLIEGMYARTSVSVRVGGLEVRVPSWFLREKGLTPDALVGEPGGIRVRHSGSRLPVERAAGGAGRFRVGSFVYGFEAEDRGGGTLSLVDLDPLLRVARSWVGNTELARFVGEGVTRRPRPLETAHVRVSVLAFLRPALLLDEARERFRLSQARRERGAEGVHAVASYLLAALHEEAEQALGALERFLEDPSSEEAALARGILPLLSGHVSHRVRRRALLLLLQRVVHEDAAATLRGFLDADPAVFDPETQRALLEQEISVPAVRSILAFAGNLEVGGDSYERLIGRQRAGAIFRFLAELGARYPRWYTAARQVLVVRSDPAADEGAAAAAASEARRLEEAFRMWAAAAVSGPDAGPQAEVGIAWDRVVGFDERVEPEVRVRLLHALASSTLLTESIFLLGEQVLVHPRDLLDPGGIWVAALGTGHGKTVLRLTVCTRQGRVFEFVAKILQQIPPEDAASEVAWMIRLGTSERTVPLVPEFGAYWPEVGVWSEEYIAHETVETLLRTWTRAGDPERIERLVALWPHFAWCALTTFVEFWQRTGRRLVLAEPLPFNVVVAPEDYQEASRLVSVSARVEFQSLAGMMREAYEAFVTRTEEAVPLLRGVVDRRIVFSAFLEAFGEEGAIPLLWRALAEMRETIALRFDPEWKAWQEDLIHTIEEVERSGYTPRRLVMAVRRYHDWSRLNPGAATQARAMTLQELYETYSLDDLEAAFPAIRVRFFRMTVFAQAREELATELDALARAHRDTPLPLETLLRRMAILHQTRVLGEEEQYFLARMTYAHLQPLQRARLELHVEGGETMVDLIEETRDAEGGPVHIRAATSPKEVMRLHRLFEQAGLSVVFRADHRFLLGVDANEAVVGGIFYRVVDLRIVHMEKIVVASRVRGRAVGGRLMESFLQRMKDAHFSIVTTGFFRPDYFYRFGFRLERGFAGLVKQLSIPDGATPAPGESARPQG
jgi:long-subunit acyl-CoA synthetase (AMP-forming)